MATERQIRMGDYRPPPWPEDFPQRLERLKEMAGISWKRMAGISWKRMAELVGVTDRGALKWRRGGGPSAANFRAIIELAREIPGGYDLMMDGDDGKEE